MANSINTNISAYYAQANIAKASSAASTSVSRLSSGNFITKASDDVARLSIGTSFATTVKTLRQALVNASQGVSLLQVADGALGQVTEILQRQKTLAVQASSGNLSNNDRSFLNQEFQALSEQIDFIASTASFNGVKLLDGALSTSARLDDATKQAAAGTASISLNSNLADGDTITINGLVFTAKNTPTTNQQFQIGATSTDTIRNLAAKLTTLTTSNAATITDTTTTFAQKLGANTYEASGTELTIASRSGGSISNRFTIDASATSKFSVSGAYASATVDLLASNVSAFTSATTTIAVASGQSATAPFKVGDALKIQIDGGSKTTLHTFQAGDSLTDIVNGINGNTASTGVSAALIGDSTNGYNIRLTLNNSTGDNVSLFGGDNFYKVASSGLQTTTLSGATSTARLLSTSLATAIGSTTATVVGTPAATTPFATGSRIFASVGGEAYVDISGALGSSDGLDDIVALINSNTNAGALGIVASLVSNNIQIKYADSEQTGAISFYSGTTPGTANTVPNTSTIYNTDALGQTRTNGLGGSFVSFNLLSSGVSAPDLDIDAAASTVETPIVSGSDIVLTINDSATTSKVFTITVAATTTLQELANQINNSNTNLAGGAAGTEDYGIHASVVVDSEGKYNLQLSYAASALPPAGTGGSAAANGIRVTYSNAGVLSTINTTGTLNNDTATTAYSTVDLFSASTTSATLTTDIISGASAAAHPLVASVDYVISVNGATITIAAADLVEGLSFGEFIDLINEDSEAKAAGVTASLINAGTSSANIQLRVADTSGTGVKATALTTTQTGSTNAQTAVATTYVDGTTTHTTYRLFNTTFANAFHAGGSVVAATPTATTPFDDGANITVRYSTGTDVNLLAAGAANLLETGDTLAEIVRKINANSATSGFTAELDGNGTNILLKDISFAADANAQVYFRSANFFTNNTGGVTNGFNNSYSSVNLFATDFAASAATDTIQNATPDADDPLDTVGTLTISFDVGATTFNVTQSLAGTVTAQTVIDTINSDSTAIANGIHAEFVDLGGGRGNIKLYFADTENTGAVLTGALSTAVAGGGASDIPAGNKQTSAATTSYVSANSILSKVNTYAATTNAVSGITSNSVIGLSGGLDDGLGFGSVTVTGSVSDAILTSLAQKSATSTIGFPDTDDSALTDAFSSKTITVAGATFTFVTTATSPLEIAIGDSLQETLDNAVSTINEYGKETAVGDTAYQLNQINVTRDGNSIVFTGKGIGDVTKLDGTAVTDIATTVANVSGPTNSGDLNNSTRHTTGTFGVDVSGVSNKDFIGSLGDFEAEYVSSNTVNLSITVGGNVYTASSVNTKPTVGATGSDSLGNQIVRFYSDTYEDANGKEISGGYFDVQLAVNQGEAVASQSEADEFAVRFSSAFQGLTFNQTRVLSSYSAEDSIINASGTNIGSLVGSSVKAQLESFDNNKLTNISVSPSSSSNPDAEISLTIDGVIYTSRGLGTQLGANQTYKFVSASDPNYFVSFTTGDTSIDLSTAENATALEEALYNAFGASEGSSALSFQIGTSSTESLGVSIASASTDDLFEGETLSIATLQGAAEASDAIDAALGTVTSIRASVGALQSRFNFASANIQISVQNQDASRSELLDTDIAAESTSYATAQVQLQAGISVLAQANQQLQALLKLLG